MKHLVKNVVVVAALAATSSVLFAPSAEAVPSYTRRYGFACSSCHTMWGDLNTAGITFKLSGYRAMFGKDLIPIEAGKDIQIPGVNVVIPGSLPFSFVTGAGYDQRTEKRTAFDGTVTTRRGSSLNLEEAGLYLTTPVGDRLSVFFEFPMYESGAWEMTPTGPGGPGMGMPGGANESFGGVFQGRNFQFDAGKPIFEIGKVFWNNLLGDALPRDSFNAAVGIARLPLGYAPHGIKFSINSYLIYERNALDLISPVHPSNLGPAGEVFRLVEAQVLTEVFGMLVPGGVSNSADKNTPWLEYHLGVTNGNNDNANNNSKFGGYGALKARWNSQSVGVFGFFKPDIYDDGLRSDPAFTQLGAMTGIFNPGAPLAANSSSVLGVDGTLSLTPLGIPISFDNQYMWRRESNPTGFNVPFNWQGGFHQVNWFVVPNVVAYARYDYITGHAFDDTPFGGITLSRPSEWDIVAGVQYAPWENVIVLGEFRHHEFKDTALIGFSPAAGAPDPFLGRVTPARIVDDGFTARLRVGF
jgi:opacity protein-like surface antigen